MMSQRKTAFFPPLLAGFMLFTSLHTAQAARQDTRQAQPTPAPQDRQYQPEPDPRRTPVVRVVEEAGPAVVSIISAHMTDKPATAGEAKPIGPGGRMDPALRIRTTSRSLGSGVIIDGRKAYVLTNAHVITNAMQITARLLDGRVYKASLVGADQDMDLAVLRLELPPGAEPLPQARMGDSSGLMIGEPLIAIGNPFGLSHTVTTGVVSALNRSVDTGQHTITGLIQTDAAINPGNSGGPLLNILGQVVGINAAVYAHGGGLGFAIPINKAKRVLEELITTGRVAHIWIGVLGENMTPDQMVQYGLMRPGGLVVTTVFPGTPAAAAGIRPGDTLLAIGEQRVQDKAQFLGILLGYTRGDTMAVLLNRGAEDFQVQLRPQVLDREAGLGLIKWRWGFGPATQAADDKTSGVVLGEVRPGGPADALGLKPGDRVLQVGSLRTSSEADLLTAFYRYQLHNQLILNVLRGGQPYTLRMKL
ncbi:MAG: trypsin-like peptidase domain-containing protein [Humidesulfovibrio sp.]|nr:trypsin-like peptidase domain-containing protein [Humidesulfovibrio sp.]